MVENTKPPFHSGLRIEEQREISKHFFLKKKKLEFFSSFHKKKIKTVDFDLWDI